MSKDENKLTLLEKHNLPIDLPTKKILLVRDALVIKKINITDEKTHPSVNF